jgi:alkanesulfonate monooxygenase SsuD/methylene tetrahydromethanopterin reductase-like flavin-dependent oxidoreductase (luciferase family)/predicted kinase
MEVKLPAPSMLVLIGPSGSGKTTWARQHFPADEVVSSDSLRAMVGSGEDDQTASTAAFELLERIVDERLKRGLTVVIDTLGYNDESRARWIEKAHKAGIPAHAMLFDTRAEVCEQRNQARDKPVPRSVLKRQISRFAIVSRDVSHEPFDGVHTQQPLAVVAPAVAAVLAREDVPQPGHHSFGLIVSRMNWPAGDRGSQLASIAIRAEAAGFRDIWVMDHFRQIRGVGRPWEDLPEAYTALSFMSGVTTTIRLGALVTGITYRSPIVLGKMVATLDVLSGGRAICGLGAAWDEAEHAAFGVDFPSLKTRYALLEESLQMLPLLWGKGTPEFAGDLIQSPELVCYPRPIQDPIPILVGGGGEKKTLRLVAQYANACNVFGDPGRVEHKVKVLVSHCDDLERDRAEVEVTHLTNALAATDRQILRERVDRLRDRNTTAETFMKRHNAGTVDDLVSLFAAYSAAGADHSIVAIPDVWEEGSIETFGEVIAGFAD